MKKNGIILAIFLIAVFSFTIGSFAQEGMQRKGDGGGPGKKQGRMYDPKTVEVITGEVARIEKITNEKGKSYGLHLIVKTGQGDIPVHLGPGWFIEKQNLKIEQNDKIEIKGSRITVKGAPAIIAAEVKKGTGILRLRDEQGIPAWKGQKKGGGN